MLLTDTGNAIMGIVHSGLITKRLAGVMPIALILAFTTPVWSLAFAADSANSEIDSEESSVELSNRTARQLDFFDQQIATIETELGPFDPALLEPLQGLTELLMESGDFEQVNDILNRRLQLIRIAEGPASLTQLSTLKELINNNIRLSRWQELTANFENIHFIHSQNSETNTLTLLETKNAVRAWHNTAIYLDEPGSRIRHFLESRQLQRQLLREAEESFGEDSPALIPWLYQGAIEQYRVVVFITSQDELGTQAKDYIVRPEQRPVSNYLREGLNIVKRIRQIVETLGDPEAEAMAMIYEADFQMLMDLGTAARLYRAAMDKFEEAAIDSEKIANFFARPVVLPVAQYHLSIDAAVAAQTAYGYVVTPGQDGDDTVHLGDYIAWNESLPVARRPEIPEYASSVTTQLRRVDLEFNISSRGGSENAQGYPVGAGFASSQTRCPGCAEDHAISTQIRSTKVAPNPSCNDAVFISAAVVIASQPDPNQRRLAEQPSAAATATPSANFPQLEISGTLADTVSAQTTAA